MFGFNNFILEKNKNIYGITFIPWKRQWKMGLLWPVCACLAPVVSGLSSRAQQHHIDMKIAPQIIFYENVARGSGSIMASSNVISIPQSCKGVSYLKMPMDYFAFLNLELVKIRVSIKHVRQMGWKIIYVSSK